MLFSQCKKEQEKETEEKTLPITYAYQTREYTHQQAIDSLIYEMKRNMRLADDIQFLQRENVKLQNQVDCLINDEQEKELERLKAKLKLLSILYPSEYEEIMVVDRTVKEYK